MTTEFLIEARLGGTCVVRVVTSAFGSGADWENEFFTEMSNSWLPLLDNLRLYLTHFAGHTATTLRISHGPLDRESATVRAAVRDALKIERVDHTVDVPNGQAIVERFDTGPLLLRLTEPAAALIDIDIWGTSPEVTCELTARSFNPDADSTARPGTSGSSP